ncbi:DUF2603 domain-containing protein [Campylobacter upsaliensis]|nr:DUF2603 domain-containing protein [Campylobacter upsaliensis]
MKEMKKTIVKKPKNALAQINDFSKYLGMKKRDLTIFEMLPEENEYRLRLKNSKLNRVEPWFIIDEDGGTHALTSLHSLNNLLDTLKKNQKEIFELKLEKAIYQQMPVDFNDAWAVAMDAVEKVVRVTGVARANVDLDRLLEDIKKEHPNLFIDMNMMMESLQNERL